MIKIYKEFWKAELGDDFSKVKLSALNKPPKTGVNFVSEMLFDNPTNTLAQFDALKKNLGSVKKKDGTPLTTREIEGLEDLVNGGIERINLQNEYFKKAVTTKKNADGDVVSVNIKFSDGTSVDIDPNSSAEKAIKAMERLAKEEALKHGDPMTALPPKKFRNMDLLIPGFGVSAHKAACEAGTSRAVRSDTASE